MLRPVGVQNNCVSVIARFICELKIYRSYLLYYAKCLEKAKVSNTVMGYLWWVIDPLLHMFIYTMLSRIVFHVRHDYYPVFFFSAMLCWRYFSTVLMQSASIFEYSLYLCRDNYVPKFIFPLSVCITTLNPFLVSLLLLLGLMFLSGLVPSYTIVTVLPFLIILFFFFTFACSLIIAHIGIFFLDFAVILPHLLMVGMFGTPIFWERTQVDPKYYIFIDINPMTFFTESARLLFLQGQSFSFQQYIYVLGFTLILFVFGIMLVYRYDQDYNKIKM